MLSRVHIIEPNISPGADHTFIIEPSHLWLSHLWRARNTLLFLTDECYTSLQYLLKISKQSISPIVPEVVKF